ncbi:MAG: HORMA domain containing protein [Chloroflexota bacterium]
MSTIVSVSTYTHTTAYITDKMLRSLVFIIRESGLDPAKFTGDWATMELGIRTWLGTRDLRSVVLEVFEPLGGEPVGRWDFDILYGYGEDGDGEMWVDTDAIRYAIKKAGSWPSLCDYRLVVETNSGRPDVAGWSKTTLRSTDGFVRHSIGTTIGASGAGTATAYWRRP